MAGGSTCTLIPSSMEGWEWLSIRGSLPSGCRLPTAARAGCHPCPELHTMAFPFTARRSLIGLIQTPAYAAAPLEVGQGINAERRTSTRSQPARER